MKKRFFFQVFFTSSSFWVCYISLQRKMKVSDIFYTRLIRADVTFLSTDNLFPELSVSCEIAKYLSICNSILMTFAQSIFIILYFYFTQYFAVDLILWRYTVLLAVYLYAKENCYIFIFYRCNTFYLFRCQDKFIVNPRYYEVTIMNFFKSIHVTVWYYTF